MRIAIGTAVLSAALVGGFAVPAQALELPAASVPAAEESGKARSSAPATRSRTSLSPAAAAKRRPALRLGSRSPAVVYVQRKLGVTPASGYYGRLTKRAVRALQEQSGLRVTGTVTKPTWKVLLAAKGVIALPAASGTATGAPTPTRATAPSPAPADPAQQPSAPPPARTPQEAAAERPLLKAGRGPGDPAVVFVQEFLQVSPATGYYGALTTRAVKAYQKGLGLSATGTVGPQTWQAIAEGRRPAPAATPTAPAAADAAVSPDAIAAAPSPSPAPPTPAPATIPTPTFTLPENPTRGDVALVHALAQVGRPYVLGGNGPDAFDCSGLVQQAYLTAGIALPRRSSQQRLAGTTITLDQLAPGDLLYYESAGRKGHISMYAGNGLAVEAANPRRGVRIRHLDEKWYVDRFVAAVRIG